MPYMTGFADEAADSIDEQIRATQELGWSNIEARKIDGKMMFELSDAEFDQVAGKLQDAGVHINCYGSAISNWAKQIDEPFESSLEEVRIAIPRMKQLGTKLVRIMSFAVLKERGPDDQMEEERFARLRELMTMFSGEGITPVHENCMNYGGMGWTYTLKLVENVPGLKLVFDTGNPVSSEDKTGDPPYPRQSSWDFYSHVKEHVAYIHIKDGVRDQDTGKVPCCYPGEGKGDVRKIINDLVGNGYDGGISIEPHMQVIHHDADVKADAQAKFDCYVEYGRRMAKIVEEAKA